MADIREGYSRIVLAVDVSDPYSATELVSSVGDRVGAVKLGLEWQHSTLAVLLNPDESFEEACRLLEAHRDLIKTISPSKLMWDGKFDDIPNTVGQASAGLSSLSPLIFNVHASAGTKAIEAAVANRGRSMVFGVTVLTSIGEEECVSIFGDLPGVKVMQFARILAEAGAQGIICSPKELGVLAQVAGLEGLKKLTPGVRPEWAGADDQKRVMAPQEGD